MAKFTHLHVHSHYSLLDGLPKINLLVDHVKKLGMDSVALTDHGSERNKADNRLRSIYGLGQNGGKKGEY